MGNLALDNICQNIVTCRRLLPFEKPRLRIWLCNGCYREFLWKHTKARLQKTGAQLAIGISREILLLMAQRRFHT